MAWVDGRDLGTLREGRRSVWGAGSSHPLCPVVINDRPYPLAARSRARREGSANDPPRLRAAFSRDDQRPRLLPGYDHGSYPAVRPRSANIRGSGWHSRPSTAATIVRRIWSALFGSPSPGKDDHELRESIEAKRQELDRRSDRNRARLTEIQVVVQARRIDTDAQ